MSNQWFRMYNEFATDPKVQSMSEAMQRRLTMLFCLQSCNGLVTLQVDELAFALRISDDELSETKALFTRKGFIDDQWNILHWDKRQYTSDTSKERVRAYRERKRNANVTTCNVTVTPPDTDTDTERKKNISKDISKKDDLILPDWLPIVDWNDFLAMRTKIRKPPTERAKQLLIAKLDTLRNKGHPPDKVLQQSILNGYQDVFKLKAENHESHQRNQSGFNPANYQEAAGKSSGSKWVDEGKRLADKYRAEAAEEAAQQQRESGIV